MDYKTFYHRLFAACADAVEQIDAQNYGIAREILIAAQQTAEESYLEEETRTDME